MDNYTAEEIRAMYKNAENKEQMRKRILPELTLLKHKQIDDILSGSDLPDPKHNRSYVPVKEYSTVAELYAKGLTEAEIAETLNYTEAAVKATLKEKMRNKASAKGKGLAKREEADEIKRTAVTEELKNKICELRRSGISPTAIADEVELNKSTVWKILKEAGLTNPPNGLKPKQTAERKENRMKQAKMYFCELCGEKYDNLEEARACAENHTDLSEFEAEQIYIEEHELPARILFKDKTAGIAIEYVHRTLIKECEL